MGLGICEVLDSEGILFQFVPLQFRKLLSLASLYGSLCKLIDGQPLGVAWSDIYTPLARRNVLIFFVFLGKRDRDGGYISRNGHGIMRNRDTNLFHQKGWSDL